MQHFFATNLPDIRTAESEHRDGLSFGSYKLDLKTVSISITVYDCSYVAFFESVFWKGFGDALDYVDLTAMLNLSQPRTSGAILK